MRKAAVPARGGRGAGRGPGRSIRSKFGGGSAFELGESNASDDRPMTMAIQVGGRTSMTCPSVPSLCSDLFVCPSVPGSALMTCPSVPLFPPQQVSRQASSSVFIAENSAELLLKWISFLFPECPIMERRFCCRWLVLAAWGWCLGFYRKEAKRGVTPVKQESVIPLVWSGYGEAVAGKEAARAPSCAW